ncbi:hypothetical protein SETIT_3G132200v2 [Setaria italica]|uniref:Uncharacterized protein n=1 Tax=Setaria italica TaxID=4555 RepID=A0A368QEW9_SETIT|nr:hypothetical protein SETIT_3G132200v2 [Setaria italica]
MERPAHNALEDTTAFLLCEVSSAPEEDSEVNSCCSGTVGTASPCTLSRADPIVGIASPCTLSRVDLETTRKRNHQLPCLHLGAPYLLCCRLGQLQFSAGTYKPFPVF